MRLPRTNGDIARLGYSTIEKVESSKGGEKRNAKGKPTCHLCGKLGHTINVYRKKTINQGPN